MTVAAFPGVRAPNDLIPEEEVLTRRPMLSAGMLKEARANGQITYTRGKRLSVWYRLCDVDEFLKTREHKCRAIEQTPYSSSPDNGSRTSPDRPTSTDTGLPPDLEEHVASRLAQRI